MINMTFMVKVRPEKRAEFLQAMRSLRGARDGHGVLPGVQSTLFRDVDDEARFSLTCESQTPEHLEAYLHAEEFRLLFGAVKVLCDTSEIRYSRTLEHFPMLRLVP
jgi:hypothetical protein